MYYLTIQCLRSMNIKGLLDELINVRITYGMHYLTIQCLCSMNIKGLLGELISMSE